MDILFVGLNYAPENVGIGPYSTELTQALVEAGHSVRVITAAPYYPAWRTFEGHKGLRWRRSVEGDVPVLRCPIYVPARPTGMKRIFHHISFALSLALPTASSHYSGSTVVTRIYYRTRHCQGNADADVAARAGF
jgi:colanic acid biosynthesis glycosyl transferase WcaI